MAETEALTYFSLKLLDNLDAVWTFFLLQARFAALLMVLPGIGMGQRGLVIRAPAIFILAMTAAVASPHAAMPADWAVLGAQIVSELLLGFMLGLIPLIIITGIQVGAQLSSTTMGLGAGNLIDPTLGVTSSDLSRIMGDLAIVLFLMIGGHYAIIYAAAGLGGQIVPGTYLLTENTLDVLVDRTAEIFRIGTFISAPVMVALLLTNFVMGLLSKAVPTVNIFIVSFPLTIGIGLILTMLSLPDVMIFVEREFSGIEEQVLQITRDVVMVQP